MRQVEEDQGSRTDKDVLCARKSRLESRQKIAGRAVNEHEQHGRFFSSFHTLSYWLPDKAVRLDDLPIPKLKLTLTPT